MSQHLKITLKAEKLPNLDTFSKTDGMAVLFEKKNEQWQLVGMTEVISDCLDPEWVTPFQVEYRFEEMQQFKVTIYNMDDPNDIKGWASKQIVGESYFHLHEVVTAENQFITKSLLESRPETVLQIASEEQLSGIKNTDKIVMSPVFDIPKSSGYRGNILFFIMYKIHSENNKGIKIWTPIYKSELKSLYNDYYQFNQFSMMKSDMCQLDPSRQIKIEVFQASRVGNHKIIGNIILAVEELLN